MLSARKMQQARKKWRDFHNLFQSGADSPQDQLKRWAPAFFRDISVLLRAEFVKPETVPFTDTLVDSMIRLESEYGSQGRICVLDCSENTFAVLAVLPRSKGRLEQNACLLEMCCALQKAIWEGLSVHVRIGASSVFYSPEQLHTAYKQAGAALGTHFFKPHNELFFYEASHSISIDDVGERGRLLEQFKNGVNGLKQSDALDALKALLLQVHVLLSDYNRYQTDMDEILQILGKTANVCDVIRKIQNCLSIEEAYEVLSEFVTGACRPLNYSPKTLKMLKFIHKNLDKNITLEVLSGNLGISAIYACQIFKKDVGISFKSYLNQKRVEKAQQLLDSGKYKIYEVAQIVGFQSATYFSNTYKRYTGRTPGQIPGK